MFQRFSQYKYNVNIILCYAVFKVTEIFNLAISPFTNNNITEISLFNYITILI